MIREILGKKIGMTHIFDEEGNQIATTLVEVKPVCILEKVVYPTKERVKIGCFKLPENKKKKMKKPILGYFNKLGIKDYYTVIKEVEPEGNVEVKKEVGIEIFSEGELVDVRAKTKGRGFQGGMKRHNWSGQPQTHGSMTHRRIGSAGASTFPGRIVKGHNMPGHMGCEYRTVKNLKILKVDKEKQLLFIKGAIPGCRGTIVHIKKVKK